MKLFRLSLSVMRLSGVVLLLVCCGSQEDTPGSISRMTVGDTLVVVNTPPEGAFPPAFRVEQDLILGVDEGEEPYMFSDITSIACDASGDIYVGEWSEGEISVFDAEGLFKYRFGRKGQGPGEFHSSWAFTLGLHIYEDHIAVEDIPRLNIYNRTGQYLKNFDFNRLQITAEYAGSIRWPIYWFPPCQKILTSWTETRGRTEGTSHWFRLFTEDLQQETVVGPFIVPQGAYYLQAGGGFSLPFASELEWTATGEATLVYGYSGEFRLNRYDIVADSWLQIILQLKPEPVPQDELEAYKQMLLNPAGQQRPDWIRAVRQAPYPSQKPFFGKLIGDDLGRIWAEEYVQYIPDKVTESYCYHLFDQNGIWLGIVETPGTIACVRSDHIFIRGREEYPTVNRYRLIPPVNFLP